MTYIELFSKVEWKLSRLSAQNPILNVFFILLPVVSMAQVSFVNKGEAIYNSNSMFVINGDVTHLQEGTINNSGEMFIRGNWTNNNSTGLVFDSGTNGWVHLDATAQTIGGTTITHFNNLELSGTGTKQLDNVDVEIDGTLKLNDREFAAGDNTVFVLSNSLSAIPQPNGGFVSSSNDGGLARNMLANNTYFFPVGSSDGSLRYRPVDILPSTAAACSFKVGMLNYSATNDGYDLSQKENTLGVENVNFYHRISRLSGSQETDVTLYYDENTDGVFELMSQWSGSLWKNLGLVNTTSNYGFNGITKSALSDFTTHPFVLSDAAPSVYVANVFSPNGDGVNDVLHVVGKSIQDLKFVIYDRWGEKIFESENVAKGWDGTFNGKPLNQGVFVYLVTGHFNSGESIDKKGNVTLIR